MGLTIEFGGLVIESEGLVIASGLVKGQRSSSRILI